jgi:hypothetical protein
VPLLQDVASNPATGGGQFDFLLDFCLCSPWPSGTGAYNSARGGAGGGIRNRLFPRTSSVGRVRHGMHRTRARRGEGRKERSFALRHFV